MSQANCVSTGFVISLLVLTIVTILNSCLFNSKGKQGMPIRLLELGRYTFFEEGTQKEKNTHTHLVNILKIEDVVLPLNCCYFSFLRHPFL